MTTMTVTAKDILIGIVSTAAGVGVLLVLHDLLGDELYRYALLAVALGLTSYLIATWVATDQKQRQLKHEKERD